MPDSLVQQQFGANAERYVTSKVHAQGHSLKRMVELADPQPGWLALDVAPGGGHSALAIARHVQCVVALDITLAMLQAARDNTRRRGQDNLVWVQADGGMLPAPEGEFDLVTCRIALHHFPDQAAAIRDWTRVLKPRGALLLVDNIGPDDAEAVAFINRFETIRDPSHGWIYPLAGLEAFVRDAGLVIEHRERLLKPMKFYPWMERMQVSMEDQAMLARMLWNSKGTARKFLNPQGEGPETTFSLQEGIIRARKP
ncbi:MAG: class I SAM-dependent methyltransferase [Chloroflexi bacterium]|nr:class I SAM-dependent methyltransferase [Chloroflexota bacterium]